MNDESSSFVEIVQPYLTIFVVQNQLLSFQWYEKQLRSNHIWYTNISYSTEGSGKKFLDGLGHSIVQGNVVKHAPDDTLKQVEYFNDSLEYIASEYLAANDERLKEVKVSRPPLFGKCRSRCRIA